MPGRPDRRPGQRAPASTRCSPAACPQVQTGKVVDPATLQYSDSGVPRELDVGLVRRRLRAGPVAREPGLHAELRPALGDERSRRTTTPAPRCSPTDANLLGPSTRALPAGRAERRRRIRSSAAARSRQAPTGTTSAPRVGFAWTPNFERRHPRQDLRHAAQETVIPRRLRPDLLRRRHEHVRVDGRQQPRPVAEPAADARARPASRPAASRCRSPLPPFVGAPLAYKDVWNQSEITFGTTGISTMNGRPADRGTCRPGTSACSARS